MSNKRQPSTTVACEPLVRSLALALPGQQCIRQHQHAWHQIVYVPRGALAIEAEGRRWPLPPRCCLWVPAGVEHSVESVRRVSVQTVYLHPRLAAGVPSRTRLIETTALLRQLIGETIRLGVLDDRDPLHASLAALLAELVVRIPSLNVGLPLPRDPRAVRVARAIVARPGDTCPILALAAAAGGSKRTLERLFLSETELSIGRWRQRARIQHAVRRLVEGATVSSVALDCGYESPSAFIAAFRREMGVTPGMFRANLST